MEVGKRSRGLPLTHRYSLQIQLRESRFTTSNGLNLKRLTFTVYGSELFIFFRISSVLR